MRSYVRGVSRPSSLFYLPFVAFRLEQTSPGLDATHMELWTEYEGRTIDGAFPLKKLLQPEGRSAFFSTSTGKGEPTVIRLIESHFDDDEILARWRGVAALHHPNILNLEQYGHVELDETSVVYAVMEPVDANLSEVLSQQRLTVADTRQLAASLAAALGTLHTHGFVHEHIEPANVFAVGEVVKLRSDCIREAPEGEDGQKLKRRDVHDLAVVLLMALTQKRTLEAAVHDLPLPMPFDQIVRQGISGEWGIEEITAALGKVDKPTEKAPSPRPTAAQTPVTPTTATPTAVISPTVISKVAAPKAATPAPQPPPKQIAVVPAADHNRRATDKVEDKERSSGPKTVSAGTSALEPPPYESKIPLPKAVWITAAGVAAVLFLWLIWHFAHRGPATPATAPQATSTPAPAGNSNAAKPASTPSPIETAKAPPAPPPSAQPQPAPNNSPAGARTQWRVIAYTYNREDQAQKKSATIAHKHSELHPEVFTPSGHAPYLVAIGGTMSRDEAFALAKKVRRQGLPRDTYAQNYSGR